MSWNLIISNVLQMDSADLHCVISEQSQNYIGGYYLISTLQKYSLQGTTQGNGLTGGLPPVRFSM